ncbi:MAG: hemolysin family protein [Actinomycetota bacterium]|nr:hemolysin family protein [Actinomycetota bacterium]
MTGAETLMVVAILALLMMAAFFALSETSLTRVNRVKAISLEEEGKRGSRRLTRLVEHPERFLNPVLLLVLVCHMVLASLVTTLTGERFGDLGGVLVAIVFDVVAIFVLAEVVPKTWAVQHPERAALFVAPAIHAIANFLPIRMVARALIGLANVLIPGKGIKEGPFVSEEELLAMADTAADEEVIEREERALIHSIIRFGDTVVREVMVPRTDMIAVEIDEKVGDVMERAMSVGHSRFPVYDDGIDDIAGVLYIKDLMRAEREGKADEEIRPLVREAHFVPETKRANDLLKEMQLEKYHMAVVVDEYGGTAGLVTLEDLIEELVGEIIDEFDVEEKTIEPLANGDVRVDGRMPIDELNQLLKAELPTGEWDTVAGLVCNLMGHVPSEGEEVDADGHRLTAERVQRRRIGRVRIAKLPRTEAEPEREAERQAASE